MRTIGKLTLAVLLVAATVGLGAEPAGAGDDFCAGQGSMSTTSRLLYAGFGNPSSSKFSLTLDADPCLLDHAAVAVGGMTGNCGLATGLVDWDGHLGTVSWVGGTIVFQGEVEGTLVIAADPRLPGQACTSGADQFLVVGGVLLQTV